MPSFDRGDAAVTPPPPATGAGRELLAAAADRLAASGAEAETLFPGRLTEVPADLAEALRREVPPPDRTRGWSVARGLLGGFGDPGPTPADWRHAPGERTRRLDLALLLAAAHAGRPFGWPGQQDGRLVHNILPSKGKEEQQVGAGSTAELLWHTEDAFHRRRADYVVLACVRNDDEVACRVSAVRRLGLSAASTELLSRPLAVIGPDDSYPQDGPRAARPVPGVPTVWAGEDGPCLRYDPAYTRLPAGEQAFRETYRDLGRRLDEAAEDVVLHPGDVLFIDNDVAVHGRGSFRPRYDGTDRWLKRVLLRVPRRRPPAEDAEGDHGQIPFEPQETNAGA